MNLQPPDAPEDTRTDYEIGLDEGRTEQAAEIVELKAKLAEVMPLAKFGAMTMASNLLMNHDYGTVDRAIEAGLISDDGSDGLVVRSITYAPNIEATIKQLLKD